jgi:hypothetical protein
MPRAKYGSSLDAIFVDVIPQLVEWVGWIGDKFLFIVQNIIFSLKVVTDGVTELVSAVECDG